MQINEDFAELLGAFIGDGWIETRESGFYILGDVVEDKEYYDKTIGPLFKRVFHQTPKIKFFKSWSAYGVVIYKKDIIRNAIRQGFQKGKKAYTVTIPLYLLRKRKRILSAIVRGVFDTDGSFHCKKGYGKYDNAFRKKFHCAPKIEISSVSLNLLKQLIYILKKIKINCVIRIGSKGGLKNERNCKTSHKLTIYRKGDIDKFFKVIKPKNNRHLTRYGVWKKFGFLPPRTTITERKKILKKEICPYDYYAGVAKWSNAVESKI